MDTLLAHQNETLDALCYRYYGDNYSSDLAAQVYQANLGLASQGPLLAANTPVKMPQVEKTETKEVLQLWN